MSYPVRRQVLLVYVSIFNVSVNNFMCPSNFLNLLLEMMKVKGNISQTRLLVTMLVTFALNWLDMNQEYNMIMFKLYIHLIFLC